MTRIILVTGGTRGIGKAISKKLHKDGNIVIANYANNDEIANKFNAETGIKCMKWDISSLAETNEAIGKIASEHGGVDILVNNAGITRDGMMHKMSEENWANVIATNLNSVFYCTKACIDHMRNNNFGRIINISSINGQKGQMGQTNYSAAKAGIIGFSRSLALESARKNITVNVVAPGYIETEMVKKIDEKILQQIVAQIPVGRLGQVDEVARAVEFLASEDAGFITGSVISVNGGQYFA